MTMQPLLVGAAEIDITPPVGNALAGNLAPRPSIGIDDPLTFKAVVVTSGGHTVVYVLFDLLWMFASTAQELLTAAHKRTSIPVHQIVWAASHTHTGPYLPNWPHVDQTWLATLPEKFADVVADALAKQQPATLNLTRAYSLAGIHNRRLSYKDGRAINTWLLNSGEQDVQCIGSSAPIDPEVGIISFDDTAGQPIAILWHFALHCTTNFGPRYSADYPGIVAQRLREKFGSSVVPIFMPGTCGDINGALPEPPAPGIAPGTATAPAEKPYKIIGDHLASLITSAMKQRKPRTASPRVACLKRAVTVPCKDHTVDQEARIEASQWPLEQKNHFREQLKLVRQKNAHTVTTLIQAWRIGDVAFVTLPGEAFVEWGMKIKQQSPFPWTFPINLGGDCVGYLVTPAAWKAGGYESLITRYSPVSVEGAEILVETALLCLRELWES